MNIEYLWILLHSDDDEGREMLFQLRNIVGITEKFMEKGDEEIRVTNIMGVDGSWYRVKESAKEIKDMLSKAYGGR
jgi:hypothetical protein